METYTRSGVLGREKSESVLKVIVLSGENACSGVFGLIFRSRIRGGFSGLQRNYNRVFRGGVVRPRRGKRRAAGAHK